MTHQARDRLDCSWPDLCCDSKSNVSVGVFNSWCSSDQWAIQFLQLEKLYHERLLSNLAALQDNWGTATSLFLPSERFYQRSHSECNSVKYACFQRASGERGRTPGAVCLLRRTASVRNTLRSWVRSAAHTSGTPRHTNTGFIGWNQSTLHGWRWTGEPEFIHSCFCLPSCKKGWTLILPSNIHLFIFPTPQFIRYETAQLLLSCLFLPSPSSLSDTNLSAPILLNCNRPSSSSPSLEKTFQKSIFLTGHFRRRAISSQTQTNTACLQARRCCVPPFLWLSRYVISARGHSAQVDLILESRCLQNIGRINLQERTKNILNIWKPTPVKKVHDLGK